MAITTLPPSPLRSAFLDAQGRLDQVWAKWFELNRELLNEKSAKDSTDGITNNVSVFDDTGTPVDSGIDITVVLETDDIFGTANQITVTDNGNGTLTISLPQDIAVGSVPTFNSTTLSGVTGDRLVQTNPSSTLTHLVPGTHIADSSTSHSITDPADAPATADALRDDLVANTLPDISAALDALGTKINSILTALEDANLLASS